MENNNMSGAFALPPLASRYRRDFGGESFVCESAGDFTLPDYMPEIRKILKVTQRVLPAGKYVGSSKAEFSGSVAYTVVYAGEGGRLAASNLSIDWEISVPLGENAQEAEDVFAEFSADNAVCRLGGPRRLNFRTRVKALAHIMAGKTADEKTEGCECAADEMTIERLIKPEKIAQLYRGESGEFEIAGQMTADTGEAEPVYCEGTVYISEIKPVNNSALCRGELWARAVYANAESGVPFCISKRIPFERSVSVEGATPDSACRANGRCVSVEINSDGTSVTCSAAVEIDVTAANNISLPLTRDIYSTKYSCGHENGNFQMQEMIVCRNSNLSVDRTKAPENNEIPASASVFDVSGDAEATSVEFKDGRAIVNGTAHMQVLLSSGEKENINWYTEHVDIPVRVELDCPAAAADNPLWYCDMQIIGARARFDGELTVNAEVETSLYAAKRKNVTCVTAASLDKTTKAAKHASPITVFYPEEGDTLWDVAKTFSVPVAALAAENSLAPDAAKEIPADTRVMLVINKK